ncbi:MAG: glycoside hydrolase family 25 protein [Crocinitomicaceae bacterium]|nr:glycoside hydrolase family 25 protein [Crocinitomicaceae bacterium]MBK8924427.1 glycoside hydrolase family 25 protein [Crocinitomicaceae bacterium]
MGKLVYGIVILSILSLFAWLMLQQRAEKSFIYPDFGVPVPENFTLLGIDVSHYQGEINWTQVSQMSYAQDSISFAYIKVSEGLTVTDDLYEKNCDGAEANQIKFGLYHFFRFENSAREQALRFASYCLEVNDSLLPVVDVEIHQKKKSALVDSVRLFLDVVEQKTKRRPMIYTSEKFFQDYFEKSLLMHEKFWIANFNRECNVLELPNVLVWQFSESATVNGIGHPVDMNVAKPEFYNQ